MIDASRLTDEIINVWGQLAWVVPFLRIPPPDGWRLIQENVDGNAYRRGDDLSVIISGSREQDGKRWLHLSVALPNKMPKWEQFMKVRRQFLPDDLWAYQVIPPPIRHVNIHPYCLHMFACVDGPQLPDFARGGSTL